MIENALIFLSIEFVMRMKKQNDLNQNLSMLYEVFEFFALCHVKLCLSNKEEGSPSRFAKSPSSKKSTHVVWGTHCVTFPSQAMSKSKV